MGRGRSSNTPSHFILQKPEEIRIESHEPVGLKKLYFSYSNQS